MADGSSERFVLLNHLAEEFAARYREGERPSLQEYIDRHPELADDIREFFPTLVEMEQVKDDRQAPVKQAASDTLPPLERLGDFRIIREIGHGGMGVVYEAEQVSLGRHVALKVLPKQLLANAQTKRRFQREAKAAAKLHHTNIVPVFGVGEHEGLPYYVMQFIPGLGLDEVLEELQRLQPGKPGSGSSPGLTGGELRVSRKDVSAAAVARSLVTGCYAPAAEQPDDSPAARSDVTAAHAPAAVASSPGADAPGSPNETPVAGRLSETFSLSSSSAVLPGTGRQSGKKRLTYWQSVAKIGVQVADALEYAHRQGILHRDIQPSNLLLDTTGTVWVTDFGLAKADDQENLTHTGDVLGTLRYMPPEAFDGKTDARSDVYALGLTLYELLAFRPAFDEKERNRLIKQVTTAEPARLDRLNREAPRDLVTIVHKAIERDPGRRYPTAAELEADLKRFLDDEPIKARRQTQLERYVRWARHHPGIAVLGGVLTAVLVLVTAASLLAAGYFNRAAQSERDARQEAEDARAKAATSAAAEAAERDKAQGALYHSLVGESRATRAARQVGYRERVFELLREASRLETPERDPSALRREAAEALGDFVGNRPWMLPSSLLPSDYRKAWFDPLTHRLAISQAGGKLRYIDPAEGREAVSLSVPGGEIQNLSFAPDGRRMAIQSSDGNRVYRRGPDHDTWTLDRTLERGSPFPHLTADGRTIAVQTSARPWSLRDLDSGATTEIDPLAGQSNPDGIRVVTHGIALSPDGRLLAASLELTGRGTPTLEVVLFDAATGALKARQAWPFAIFTDLRFSDDGALLACGGDGGFVVYSTAHGLPEIIGPMDTATSFGFGLEGRLLVVASIAGGVKIWSTATRRELASLSLPSGIDYHANISADGRWVYVANTWGAGIWDRAGTGERLELSGHAGGVPGIAFAPDGRLLASTSKDGTVRIWDPETGLLQHVIATDVIDTQSCAFSLDGSLLAIGSMNGKRLWLARTGDWRELPQTVSLSVTFVACHPDGRRLAVATLDGLEILELRQGDGALATPATDPFLKTIQKVSSPRCTSCALSRDGRYAAFVESDHRIRILEVQTGRAVPYSGPGLLFGWHGLAFRSANELVFVAADSTLEVWDVPGDRHVKTIGASGAFRGGAIAVSADGRWAAAERTSERVALIDLEQGEIAWTFREERGSVWSLAFSPDGRRLAVGLSDGGLAVWKLDRVRTLIDEALAAPHG
ncbi:MAG TPA: protein kinase [Gemmataceae bacterium]|nr:protein kinase [Gemmataceae bacterium]